MNEPNSSASYSYYNYQTIINQLCLLPFRIESAILLQTESFRVCNIILYGVNSLGFFLFVQYFIFFFLIIINCALVCRQWLFRIFLVFFFSSFLFFLTGTRAICISVQFLWSRNHRLLFSLSELKYFGYLVNSKFFSTSEKQSCSIKLKKLIRLI